MKILVTNDDGIHSEGLHLLVEALREVGEVIVVAPERERSSVAHALTMDRPLRINKVGDDTYTVDGTPVDCVILGTHMLRPERPAIIASGINKGGNMGEDILYSGTVSAALEGTIMGIPSFAVSTVSREDFKFRGAAEFAVRVARFILRNGLPRRMLLNVNVPNLDPEYVRSYRITRQGKRIYGDVVCESNDPRGRRCYWIGSNELRFEREEGTDFEAVSQGYVSVTPLHPNLTCSSCLREMKSWEI
ncbi:MAG: 5'/3'-nucleotidase SurE [Deltaproteobacteria bacterium]|nr:5'/3'-nucleotidase SurE [Deltaproteobacteria bacterium]